MRIEKVTANQLPRIVELKLAMFQEAGLAYLLADDFLTRVLQDYQALYASQDAVHFVALERGEVVAMAGGFLKSDLPYRYYKQPCYGFVGDVYTTPAARHKGLASQLSRMVLEWLKSRGVRHVRLLATPAARPIYERLGFRATDEMALSLDDV
jgi:GNAT superfamily N-acetyltransferase